MPQRCLKTYFFSQLWCQKNQIDVTEVLFGQPNYFFLLVLETSSYFSKGNISSAASFQVCHELLILFSSMAVILFWLKINRPRKRWGLELGGHGWLIYTIHLHKAASSSPNLLQERVEIRESHNSAWNTWQNTFHYTSNFPDISKLSQK